MRQRWDILAAALALFAEKGYHNVSMREIADRSEFAVGTLYKFFQNKEDLYKALVLEECSKIEDTLVEALEEPVDELEKLRSYLRAKNKILMGNLPFVRLFLAESKGVGFNIKADMDESLQKRYFVLLGRLAAVFESGIKNKRFARNVDPYYLAVAFDNISDAFFQLWLVDPERHPNPEDPEITMDIFFKGHLAK